MTITKTKRRTYKSYLLSAPSHYESIVSRYGMPPTARPPLAIHEFDYSSDKQFRQALSRTLYLKKGGSFNAKQQA